MLNHLKLLVFSVFLILISIPMIIFVWLIGPIATPIAAYLEHKRRNKR